MLKDIKLWAYGISTAVLRWHFRRNWGMTIGEGVRISHSAKLDRTNPKGVKIGDYTAVAFDAAILTHDFVNGVHRDVCIGSNTLIGARAVIMPGVTVGDHCIVGPGSVVLSDVPSNTAVLGNPARMVERDIITGKWGIRNPKFLEMEGLAVPKLKTKRPIVKAGRADLLQSYFPAMRDPNRTFNELGIDSFSLVTLRAEIEETEGSFISDDDWTSIERPIDLLKFITRPKAHGEGDVVGPTLKRSYEINMPQMTLGGLSESWLFKEVGDVHWAILTASLGTKSRDIADQGGDRLYPTFTRIRYQSSAPLAAVRENDRLDIAATMTRFGAGMFCSSVQLTAPTAAISFEVASSFSKFGESGENTSLVRGQPAIPDGFEIPSLPDLPCIVTGYRDLRAEEPSTNIFETEYEIIPQHDINGVGLLYFAAYPLIADICLMRLLGPGAALAWSPTERDVCYFANSGADERLMFRLHSDEGRGKCRSVVSSLYRASDGKRMARIAVTMENTG